MINDPFAPTLHSRTIFKPRQNLQNDRPSPLSVDTMSIWKGGTRLSSPYHDNVIYTRTMYVQI